LFLTLYLSSEPGSRQQKKEEYFRLCGELVTMKGPRAVNSLPGLRLRRLVPHGQSVQIAKALGLSPQTLSQYLTGRRSVPNEVLAELARRFNISTDELLAPEGESSLDRGGAAARVPVLGSATAGNLAEDPAGGWQEVSRVTVGEVEIIIRRRSEQPRG
jgi:transcriptional regulator with XRE-family HTH domain